MERRSPPAQNARPWPVRRTTRAVSSAATCRRRPSRARETGISSALPVSGRFSVTWATPSRTSRSPGPVSIAARHKAGKPLGDDLLGLPHDVGDNGHARVHVADQTLGHARPPHAALHVAGPEDVDPPAGPRREVSDVLETGPGCIGDIGDLFGDAVARHSGGVVQFAEDQDRVALAVPDNLLLDVFVN